MPVHDLLCAVCGEFRPDVRVPLVKLERPEFRHGHLIDSRVEFPVHCGRPMSYVPSRRTAFSSYDVNGSFDVQVDDARGGHVERVSSISDLRRLERESELRARNGEGRPLVWRDYSQDRSNFDVHTLGKSPQEQPIEIDGTSYSRSELLARAKAKGMTVKSSLEEPVAALGPGVTDDSASSL